MLVELGLVEQRYKAVLEVLNDGATVTDVARRYGVARQTVHAWLRKYASSGLGALADQSCRPATCPHQMNAGVEARIVELRRAHPTWGPRTILHQLGRDGIDPLPGRSSVYRALIRHGLIDPKRRRRRRSDYKRWERSRAMELWQMDITGGVKLSDGSQVSVVTGIDDHSRFCVSAMVVVRSTAKPVCDALAAAMRIHGMPDGILTDNGKVFTGRFGPAKGEVLFDRICRENGIRHLLTAPHSPTTTGKVERFHKTLKREFLGDKVFETVDEAQGAIDGWVHEYNHERPHQSLGDRPPIERFSLARREGTELAMSAEVDQEPEPPVSSAPRSTRRVDAQGKVSLLGFRYHAGRWLAGETVELMIRDGLIEIVHDGVLVASHAKRHPVEKETDLRRQLKARPARPATVGRPVVRKVGKSGYVSFAAADYRVGNAYRGRQVEVSVIGDTVPPSKDGSCGRTPSVTTDRRSTGRSPPPVVDRGGSMLLRTLDPVSRRNRSRLVAGVPELHR